MAVAVDGRRGHVFVVNQGSDTVTILDARTGQTVATVRVGITPTAVAVDGVTGRAFITLGSGNGGRVGIINTQSGAFLHAVAVGAGPIAAAVDEQTGHAFVVSGGVVACPLRSICRHTSGSSVSMLDARTGTVLHTVALASGTNPWSIAVDTGTSHAFVTSLIGSVIVLDTRSGCILRTVRVAQNAGDLSVDRRIGRVFVLHRGNARNDDSSVSMLDAHSGRVLHVTRVGRGSSAIDVSEQTGHVFVTNGTDSSVSVLDAGSNLLVRTITVAQGPSAVVVAERTGKVYVASADVSNGMNSDISRESGLPDRVATTLRNGIRTLRQGRTGSVSVIDVNIKH